MKKYICQLKSGYMLVQEGANIVRVKTGYPYPDTEKSNLEMLQDLVYKETGIMKPTEYFYNYIDAIQKFISITGNIRFSAVSLAWYLLGGDIAERSNVSYTEILCHNNMKILFLLENSSVLIVGNEFKTLTTNQDEVVKDSFCRKVANQLIEYCVDVDCELEFTAAQVIELLKLFLESDSVDVDISLELYLFIDVLFDYINKIKISGLMQDYASAVCSTLKIGNDIHMTEKDIIKIFRAIEYDNELVLDYTTAFLFIIYYTNNKLNRVTNEDTVIESCRMFLLVFTSSLAHEVHNAIHKNIVHNEFSKLYTLTYSDGILKFKLNIDSMDFNSFYFNNDFDEFSDTISAIVGKRNIHATSSYGVSPSRVGKKILIWDLNFYIAKDSIDLIPILFIIDDSIKLGGVKSLFDTNKQVEILSGMFKNLKDTRYIVFDNRKPLEEFVNDLKSCFKLYNINVIRTNSDDFEVNDGMNKYYIDIPSNIINLVGDFSLFAKIFYYAPSVFIETDSMSKYVHRDTKDEYVIYRYRFSLYSATSTRIPLEISNEMFESGVKGACIVDFIRKMLLKYSEFNLDKIFPISIKDISVDFDESSQEVKLMYNIPRR